MNKSKRAGKVFVDWSQNDRHKTTVNVYSLRAMANPTVSTPLTHEGLHQLKLLDPRWIVDDPATLMDVVKRRMAD